VGQNASTRANRQPTPGILPKLVNRLFFKGRERRPEGRGVGREGKGELGRDRGLGMEGKENGDRLPTVLGLHVALLPSQSLGLVLKN